MKKKNKNNKNKTIHHTKSKQQPQQHNNKNIVSATTLTSPSSSAISNIYKFFVNRIWWIINRIRSLIHHIYTFFWIRILCCCGCTNKGYHYIRRSTADCWNIIYHRIISCIIPNRVCSYLKRKFYGHRKHNSDRRRYHHHNRTIQRGSSDDILDSNDNNNSINGDWNSSPTMGASCSFHTAPPDDDDENDTHNHQNKNYQHINDEEHTHPYTMNYNNNKNQYANAETNKGINRKGMKKQSPITSPPMKTRSKERQEQQRDKEQTRQQQYNQPTIVNIPPSTSTETTSGGTSPPRKRKTVRDSLVRVGSRLMNNFNPSISNVNIEDRDNNYTSKNLKKNYLTKYPASPAARASNYNHVQDAVAINFQEAVSERGINAVPLGIVGFRNMGNTCYINSSLQCLSATIPLTDYFLGYDYRSEINHNNALGTGGKLVTEYAQLMKSMWLGSGNMTNNNNKNGGGTQYSKAIEPIAFKRVLEKFASQFQGNSQHDSQELLSYLLDGIHEDLNRIKTKPYIVDNDCDGNNDEIDAINAWKNYLRRNKSLIVDLFQGQLRNEMQCLTCHHKNIRFEAFMYLSLPIHENVQNSSIEKCLQLYLQKEYLVKDNQWYCSKCKCHRDATKKIDLWVLPPILIIHLKRFKFTESHFGGGQVVGTKFNIPISFRLSDWDLSQYVKSKGSEKPMYNLYAISNHIGGLGSGHYTAYSLSRFNDQWYDFNDSTYQQINENVVKNNTSSAYMLFYNRVTGALPQHTQPSPSPTKINGVHNHGDMDSPSRASVESANSSHNGRVPLIRRQSVSRPDLWPHTQVMDSQFREFARSTIVSPPPIPVKLTTPITPQLPPAPPLVGVGHDDNNNPSDEIHMDNNDDNDDAIDNNTNIRRTGASTSSDSQDHGIVGPPFMINQKNKKKNNSNNKKKTKDQKNSGGAESSIHV